MQDENWWKEFVISVPRPIPKGYMVGMRDEVRDGKHYVVEFLEPVPEYQSNPLTRGAWGTGALCIDLERDGEVILSWSRERGFITLDS